MEQASMDLFAPRAGEKGDALDRFYTPDLVAEECVRRLIECGCLEGLDERKPIRVVEPNVGGGGFVRAWRRLAAAGEVARQATVMDIVPFGEASWASIHVTGVDIDASAHGFGLCDAVRVAPWEDVAHELTPGLHVATGNPPFSMTKPSDRDRTMRNIIATVSADLWAGLILPADFLLRGGAYDWLREPEVRPSRVIPMRGPRIWPRSVREVAWHVWRPRYQREAWGWPSPVLDCDPIWYAGGAK